MGSKWLTWKPTGGAEAAKIIEKTVDSELPKLPKPPFVGFGSARGGQNPIIRGPQPQPDPYQAAVEAALHRMLEYPYPDNALLWASVWRPKDYDDVKKNIPGRIHDMWTSRAPMAAFQAVLDRLVGLHMKICQAFVAYRVANPKKSAAIVRAAGYVIDSERSGVVCAECGVSYRSIAGWRVHIARERCIHRCPGGREEDF
jgi:hypothetical protein